MNVGASLQATGQAAYGDAAQVGLYLGARSARTARRLVAELRGMGLPVYRLGNRDRFKFRDVDRLLAKEGGQ